MSSGSSSAGRSEICTCLRRGFQLRPRYCRNVQALWPVVPFGLQWTATGGAGLCNETSLSKEFGIGSKRR